MGLESLEGKDSITLSDMFTASTDYFSQSLGKESLIVTAVQSVETMLSKIFGTASTTSTNTIQRPRTVTDDRLNIGGDGAVMQRPTKISPVKGRSILTLIDATDGASSIVSLSDSISNASFSSDSASTDTEFEARLKRVLTQVFSDKSVGINLKFESDNGEDEFKKVIKKILDSDINVHVNNNNFDEFLQKNTYVI